MIYETENIKIEFKPDLTAEEILAVTFYLLTTCGHEIELEGLIDEEDYLESLGAAN